LHGHRAEAVPRFWPCPGPPAGDGGPPWPRDVAGGRGVRGRAGRASPAATAADVADHGRRLQVDWTPGGV